jgi:hypothetical protein
MIFKAVVTSFVVDNLQHKFPLGATIINTDNILDMVLSGNDDALIKYKLNPADNRESPFWFIVSNTLAAVIAGANVTPTSNIMTLPIFEEDDVTDTAVIHYYNVKDLVWAHNYGGTDTSALARNNSDIYILEKGWDLKHKTCDKGIVWIDLKYCDGTTTATTTFH